MYKKHAKAINGSLNEKLGLCLCGTHRGAIVEEDSRADCKRCIKILASKAALEAAERGK